MNWPESKKQIEYVGAMENMIKKLLKKLSRTEGRLYPSRFSSRFYILTLLRKSFEDIIVKYINTDKDSSFLVDFGCGSQPYRPIFEKHKIIYKGVDIPDNPMADFYIDHKGKTPLGDNSADIVLSSQVLEHVDQPVLYLHECRRILKPGGLLILSTHGYWIYHPDPKDLWRWTSEGLQMIVEGADFDIVQFKGLMGLPATALQLLQDSIMPRVPRLFQRLGYMLFQMLIQFVDRITGADAIKKEACVFVVVGKKSEPDQKV